MYSAQQQRTLKKAAQAVARALIPKKRLSQLQIEGDAVALTSRLSTFQVMIDQQIEALAQQASRQNAVALVLIADLCWQVLRAIADLRGANSDWLAAVIPADHRASDADVGDAYYSMQLKIVEDAKWIFDLHTALRHPRSRFKGLMQLLRDPINESVKARLIEAAMGIRQVLLVTQARLG